MSETITSLLTRKKIYSRDKEKELWEVYWGWGRAATNSRLIEYARSKGWFDPEKGEPSPMGPRWAMWRYAFRQPQEAHKPFKNWLKEYAVEVAEEKIDTGFEAFLIEVFRHVVKGRVFREGTIKKWCRKWGLDYDAEIEKMKSEEDAVVQFS
jgi:hypothetical protein